MLSVGIIGLGGWGRRLVESVQGRSDKIRVAAAVTGIPAKAQEFAARHGFPVGDDLDALLADPDITAVVSAGPAGLHAEHSLRALKAGKHVLAVKPMAVLKADAEALEAAARQSGRLLALGYNRCFYPNVRELRRRVATGEIGKLVHAEGNFCVDRYRGVRAETWKASVDQQPPGSLADHMLYLMIELLGPVAEVHAVGTTQVTTNLPLADVTAVLLKFKGGQTGLLTAIGVTAEITRLHVFGSEGWIEMREMAEFTIRKLKSGPQKVELAELDAERDEMEAFADAVMGAAPFPVTAQQAVHGVAVIEAMARSAATGKPVALV